MRTTTTLALILGAGLGVDPFARGGRWPGRQHPRRDDNGHPAGGGNGGTDGDPNPGGGNGGEGGKSDDGDGKPKDDSKPKGDEKPNGDDTTDWKAKALEFEEKAKANSKAAEELDKIKRDQMTEDQKRQADLQASQEREAKLAAELAVERAARKHSITEDKDLELLAKLPADQVEAVAKRLAATNAAGRTERKPAGPSSLPASGQGDEKPKPASLSSALAAHYAQ
ncbi:hypothetical protein [Rhodococcus ruber]|uniref:hypothetical protein n=1 Tax=Rhodococcus ruber TaxID=1830 RepID=UPI003784CFBB